MAIRDVALALAVALWSTVATADPACRREGDRVTCAEAGFVALVQAQVDTSAALDRCLAAPPAVRPSSPAPLIGYAVGVLGAVAVGVASALLLRSPDVAQVGLGVVGLVGVAVGAVLTW